MSWKTWGYGPVHVPHAYTFPFQATADSIRVRAETQRSYTTFQTQVRFQMLAAFHGYNERDSEILRFEISVPDERRFPMKQEQQELVETVARAASQFTAAHMLSNIAAIISRYPMSQEAKDQITAALVMALPNFDDSEALKSPVGKGLVRTRTEFMHAAKTAYFHLDKQITEDAIREYIRGTSVYDTTEIKRWIK
jgi:hypothetical protein